MMRPKPYWNEPELESFRHRKIPTRGKAQLFSLYASRRADRFWAILITEEMAIVRLLRYELYCGEGGGGAIPCLYHLHLPRKHFPVFYHHLRELLEPGERPFVLQAVWNGLTACLDKSHFSDERLIAELLPYVAGPGSLSLCLPEGGQLCLASDLSGGLTTPPPQRPKNGG